MLVDREICPLGGKEKIPVDVRIIAAAREDLQVQVAQGRFREDLYYALSVIQIALPELRERREDVPLLVNHFLQKYSREMGMPTPRFTGEALRTLGDFEWSGNVRQLENVVERAVALSRGKEELALEDLPREIGRAHV